jgi:hypothetical protein
VLLAPPEVRLKGRRYENYNINIRVVGVCNLRKVIGQLEQLEQPVMIRCHGVVHPVLWFNELFFKVSHWHVVYLIMTSDMFASSVSSVSFWSVAKFSIRSEAAAEG